jgi:hypothetical protein
MGYYRKPTCEERERDCESEREFIRIWRLAKFLKSGLAGRPALGHDAEDVNEEAHAGERERDREKRLLTIK